jgi:hypothetical protein
VTRLGVPYELWSLTLFVVMAALTWKVISTKR